MKDLFLEVPSKKYQKGFESYVMAYKAINDERYHKKYKRALENFDEYLIELDNLRKGIKLKQGQLPTSTFWLISDDEVVGAVRVRHEESEYSGHIGYDISPLHRKKGYGTQILKLALEKAAELGIKDAIVTCNVENTGSRRIIEKNNGRLLGTFYFEEENENIYKYSIHID